MAPRRAIPLALVLTGIGLAFADIPAIRLVPHLFVKVEILGIRQKTTTKLGAGTIEVSTAKPGGTVFSLGAYPAGEGQKLTEVEMRLTAQPGSSAGSPMELGIATIARIAVVGSEPREVRRERRVGGEDGASFLQPVYEIPFDGGNIVAALIVESRSVPEIEIPRGGAPIIFQVALVRSTPDGPVPIEETVMRTIDGSSVTYSFHHARPGAANGEASTESLELTLLPRRTSDEILMVEASVLLRTGPTADPAPAPTLRSQAVTKSSAFDLALPSPKGADPYRLIIHAQF